MVPVCLDDLAAQFNHTALEVPRFQNPELENDKNKCYEIESDFCFSLQNSTSVNFSILFVVLKEFLQISV